MRTILATALAGILTAPAAAQSPREAKPASPREVKLEAPFELKVNEQVRIEGHVILLRFEGVSADSRCPVDVTCVWAGDAAVEIRLEHLTADRKAKTVADSKTIVLHTMPRFGSDTTYEGLVVHLDAVEPRPRMSGTIAAADYRVTLTVRHDQPKPVGVDRGRELQSLPRSW
jgi:hypothetical protein